MAENTGEVKMTPTLGLTGLTMNAMALIAPGAFLWLTFFIQATTGTTAPAMWIGIVLRLAAVPGHGGLLCGNGEAVSGHRQFLLFRRTVVSEPRKGLAVRAAFEVHRRLGLASLLLDLSRRDGRRHGNFLRLPRRDALAELHERLQPRPDVHDGWWPIVFSFGVAYIAHRGVNGSTAVNIAINVIQICALLVFSVMALGYRMNHPPGSVAWQFDSASGDAYTYEFATTNQTVDGNRDRRDHARRQHGAAAASSMPPASRCPSRRLSRQRRQRHIS